MIRPFSESAEIRCRGYSTPLQRALVDFGADVSFSESAKKMKEHYGVEIPASSIRIIVEKHANIMDKNIKKIQKKCVAIKPASIIIGESDGSMVPLVAFKNEMAGDRRKARTTLWAECRLSLAYAKGEVTPKYAATFDGVDETGKQLRYVTDLVGRSEKTSMHFTGDGAVKSSSKCDT